MSAPEIRYATEADFKAFYGELRWPSARAIVGVLDGELIAIGGIAYRGSEMMMFSDLKPAARKFRKDIVRGARRIAEMAAGKPVIVRADPSEPGARRLIESIGYQWVGSSPHGELFTSRRGEAVT